MRQLQKYKIVIALVFFIVLIIFLPLPVPAGQDVHGVQITETGEVLGNVNISIQAWRFHYLFRDDRLQGEVRIQQVSSGDQPLVYEIGGPITDNKRGILSSVGMRYSADLNHYVGGSLYYNDHYDTFMVCEFGASRCYIASGENALAPVEILRFFKDAGAFD